MTTNSWFWFKKKWNRRRRNLKRVRNLSKADVVVVSHAKSGRTWLAAMISSVYHQLYGIDERKIIRFDNFHRLNRDVPRVFFTHDNRKTPTKTPLASIDRFADKKVILLVRDPRDIAVSAYFQARRNLALRPGWQGSPEDLDLDTEDLFQYVTSMKLPFVLQFLRRWANNIEAIEHSLIVRYEDLRTKPCEELAKIMEFVGTAAPDRVIERAVEFARFENLKEKEAAGFFESDRLRPADPGYKDTFKVRRGKVGGYRDYFTREQLAEIEAILSDRVLDRFGYGSEAPASEATTGT